MLPTLVIHSARIVDDGRIDDDAWIGIEAGRIVARGHGRSWQTDAAGSAPQEIVDATHVAGPGALLTPGFIDIHCHGGGGAAFEDGAEAIRTARRAHREHGTTRALISLVSADLDRLVERTAAAARLVESDADILGIHLEGPFLDPQHHGAHDPALLRPPAPDAVARLLDAGRGSVRQVTLAPELPGGMDAVRQIVQRGCVAAIGHTGADAAVARAAFEAGASVLTHAFNAMNGIHHRAPGPVLAAAEAHGVVLEAIADGIHLDPAVISLLFAIAPGRVALVTDAMAAADAGDGRYTLGSTAVTVEAGIARVEATGAIAGSTLTQDAALRTTVSAGIGLADAVRALTETPARAIGFDRALGRLRPGWAADAVLLDADLMVHRTWTGARVA